MLFSISWRNIWRNKLRSTIMMVAIALGICAGIFTTAFYKGMADQRIEKAISTEISHLQIHKPEFIKANDVNEYIPDAMALKEQLRNIPEVKGVSNRLVIFSMVASAETAAGVKIMGIVPEDEKTVTNMHSKLVEGSYFEETRKNPVLMSRKLADKLKVKMGSKVVITMQDLDNHITSGAFRVTGLFDTQNGIYDEANIFVRSGDLARLMNVNERAAHEIAILVTSNEAVNHVKQDISSAFPEMEIKSWLEISPEMNYLTEAMDLYMYIFIVIILFALLFGLVNTMLMVVLERVKEIGMLMAVGMNKLRVFFMIVLETVFLALSGGILGVGMGAAVSKYFEFHKIDLSMWGKVYEDLGYDPYVYTSLDMVLLVNVTVLVILTGILGSIYPAYWALQNEPAEAIRIE